MAKKNIADKYWIYGEDAELAARLTSYLTRVVYNPVSYTHLDVYKRQRRHYHNGCCCRSDSTRNHRRNV